MIFFTACLALTALENTHALIEGSEKSAPDSKIMSRSAGSLLSTNAGILEFGFTFTKPLPNWSPSLILIVHASYSALRTPRSRSSSNRLLTFCPFGVASE